VCLQGPAPDAYHDSNMASSPFDERYLDALTATGTIRSYPKHTLLIQEGDLSDQIYVVVSGRLKVFLSDSDGKEIVIDALGPRQCFGEMALEGEPRSASVMTTEPCKLAVIERDEFKRFLAANPEAAYALIVTVIGRARNLTRAIGSLALLDVYGRVARLLLDNAVEEDGTLVVGERMSQQEIAKRVGASRETVSRIVTDLREGGYIGVENDRMLIYRPLPKRW
jgi:CRP/FNR family cyclic AMP-dependent transcriptional regulator